MVVFDKLPGLEVTIRVNGVQAQEYVDDEDIEYGPGLIGARQALRTVSKYIKAIDGAKFSIICTLLPKFKFNAPNLQADVSVDGNYSEGKIIAPEDRGRSPTQFDGPINFHPIGNRSMLRKYKFSELHISTEEGRLSSLKKDKAEAEKLGTIEIRIWRASKSVPVECKYRNIKSSSNEFHEKALKGQAKSHNVSYSPEIAISIPSYVNVTKLDGEDYPVAIYKFKYRSKESLKQLMIIERTPEPENSPTPSPAPDVNLNNLTAAQKERLKAFLRNEGIAAGRASNTPERKIKRERDNGEDSSNQRRRKKFRTLEVVDLTADSDEDA
ncbi:hypothetical protein BOTNAR_0153g00070 [Botryotinia narcissicola]|uniref:DUF7918 domain-containing protein n=1 Tax=Botryotinia narcissicola TaxID=278944 RepID=A0A4Z1IT55_9HELO|nr:hypothetical protein BOTNAR_0153g00070 [Botryotinia narcissicola]